MIIHDYPAKRRTADELERIASYYRAKWEIAFVVRLNVFELLFSDMPRALQEMGIRLLSRPAGFMAERAAYAVPKSRRIFYRERLHAQLRLGSGAAALIFLHELAHVLIHPGAEKAWVASGNETPAYIDDEESAEWQATVLALCLMAPASLANDCNSASDFEQRFGLDAKHASQRFEMLRRGRRRNVPPIYKEVRRELTQNPEKNTGSYLADPCSGCGKKFLIEMNNKYWCAGCKIFSDRFQDGDLLGFEP